MFLKLMLDFFSNVGPHTLLPYGRIGVTNMSNSVITIVSGVDSFKFEE